MAVLRVSPGAQRPVLEGAWPIPVFYQTVGPKAGERRRYDLAKVLRLVKAIGVYEPRMCAIEDVAGRGGQTGGSMLGYGVGMVHMAYEAVGLPAHRVSASMWKGALRCPASKPRTALMAETMIDGVEGRFRGPKGGVLDGLAEASLLAYYAWTRFGRK